MCGSTESQTPETITLELTMAEWVDTHLAVRAAARNGDDFTHNLNAKFEAKRLEVLETYGEAALAEVTQRQFTEAGVTPVAA